MPGPNTTGKPKTEDYNLGRGIVYFAPLLANGFPGAYRDLGNAPEFNVSIEIETLEHQSSRQGLRVVDKEVTLSQKMNLSITLDEINFENIASFLSGSQATHTNAAIAGFAEHEMISGAVLGRWYDIRDAAGSRAYDIDPNDLVLEVGANALVLGTDYELDAEHGRVFLPATATNGAGGGAGSLSGQDIDVTLAAEASASVVDEVRGLTQTGILGAVKFISQNPAASDAKTEYQFHKVTLKPEGDFALIGDEFSTLQLNGAAERNEAVSPASPTCTIRYVRP